MEICANYIVRFWGCIGEPAGELFHVEHSGLIKIQGERFVLLPDYPLQERKTRWRLVPLLPLQRGEIERIRVQPAWSSCLEAAGFESQSTNTVAQTRRSIRHPPPWLRLLAYVQQPTQECAGCDHYRFRSDRHPEIRGHTNRSIPLNEHRSSRSLQQLKIWRLLQGRLHPKLISLLVALNPCRPDCFAFTPVQNTELNSSGVRIDWH